MPSQRVIPSAQPKSVATFTLLSGGNPVSQTLQVLSLVVSYEVNRISSALLVMLDGEPSKESFEVSDRPDFEPGKQLEIKAGYRGTEQSIFKGLVVSHGIKVRKAGSVLVVECKDEAEKMTLAFKSKYFQSVKDSDVLEELIDAHGLAKDVEPTTLVHRQIVQYQTSDWDMALCRAEANGQLCFVKDGKVKIAKPDFSTAPVLTVQYGATVHDLDAEIDARLQYKAVKGVTWSPADQELKDTISATEPSVPTAGNLAAASLADLSGETEFKLFHTGSFDDAELQAWVDACLLKHRLAKVRGRVSIDGTADVAPGQLIELQGVGDRFTGKLYVSAVQHRIEGGNWETVIQFGVNPEWFVETYRVARPAAGGLLPPISGLQIGVVTKLEGDPDSEERIQVRIPVIHKTDDGAWCRLATLDAGSARGSYFRPELGDEVVVGFLNDDPRHAVVLGALHGSKFAPPEPLSDDNHKKGYQSREKLKLSFDDDKKVIGLETPGGNKLTLSDDAQGITLEDQHGNKVVLDQGGIRLESSKDLVLKASGDLKASGVNLQLEGSASAKLSGSGGTELSLSGTANLKGPMVNIN
jgi:Rhs element Vgr protein